MTKVTKFVLRNWLRHASSATIARMAPRPNLGGFMLSIIDRLLVDDDGQDIAEYAVMLAVILVIVVGTVQLIGSNANTVFSQAASAIQ
jgi:pilus assembly protein Flp/PilA